MEEQSVSNLQVARSIRAAGTMTICTKCRTLQKLDVVADNGAMSFCRCPGCGGMGTYRRQTARGRVVQRERIQSVVEISGEIDA